MLHCSPPLALALDDQPIAVMLDLMQPIRTPVGTLEARVGKVLEGHKPYKVVKRGILEVDDIGRGGLPFP
jgi:hypothetical protein